MCHQQDMADEIHISPYSKSVRLYYVVSLVHMAVEIGSRYICSMLFQNYLITYSCKHHDSKYAAVEGNN